MLQIESFFVGGERIVASGEKIQDIRFTQSLPSFQVDPNGTQHINQAYVQSFVSKEFTSCPVILQHGGGMTGAMWENTPDSRSGWLNYFIDEQFPTFVIDSVARGRSGWPVSQLEKLGKPFSRTEEEAWKLFRFGHAEQFESKTGFKDLRFPIGDLDKFSAQFVPRWIDHQTQNKRAMLELLDKTGPAIVVAHSHGAECVIAAAEQSPEKVKALILIEPSQLPDNTEFLAKYNIPLLIVSGDYMDISSLWRHLAAGYKRIQESVVNAGGDATLFDLNKQVGRGFSHMLMMDDGNELVFWAICDWLEKRGLFASKFNKLKCTTK